MKTILALIISVALYVNVSAEVVTKGTQAATTTQAERHWLKITEQQRIENNLWSRREWTSVKAEIRGYGADTAQMRVLKTFGNSMTPKAATTADLHCYRIVWGPAAKWNQRGLPVKFDLKYCTDGKLRQDIRDVRAPVFPPPSPAQGTPTIAEKMKLAVKVLELKAEGAPVQQMALPATQYAPGSVVVKMYFTNHPTMGRRVYAYANHPAGERWSMQTASGFYGSSFLWFTPPSYEDTDTQVRVMVPVNPLGFYFRAVKHR